MTATQVGQELNYHAALSVARSMLENALITQEEYRQIDTIFRNEYLPLYGSLYA
jgi:hypothetical protein